MNLDMANSIQFSVRFTLPFSLAKICSTEIKRGQSISCFLCTDADTEESLEMRIYDRDLKRTDTQMRKMLDEADLEKHGFKLEITTKLKQSGSGSDSEQAYQKTYFYYKIVDCSLVPEVDEQLESLIPGKKNLGGTSVTGVMVKMHGLVPLRAFK